MKKSQRRLALLLVGLMIASSFTACGGGDQSDDGGEESAQTEKTTDGTPESTVTTDGGLLNETPQDIFDNDTPEDDTPEDDTPEDDTPEDDTPEDDTPEDDTPEDDTPEDDTPEDDTPEDDTPEDDTPDPNAPLSLIVDGEAKYTLVRSASLSLAAPLKTSIDALASALNQATGATIPSTTDAEACELEVLIGNTTRDESAAAIEALGFNEFIIKADGHKLIICGKTDSLTALAIDYFIEHYLPDDGSTTIELPRTLEVIQSVDLSVSSVHGMSYVEMGDLVLEAFTAAHYENGNLKNTEFWDAAEILEAYIDAYEQTGNPTCLEYVQNIAKVKFGADDLNTNWCQGNAYNDDIAWACIAFARIYLLTGETDYLTIAKSNFDTMWARAYSPEVLGGGLWWKDDQKDTKNSCIQCPASIAACLLGKAYGDDSYYEKARELMAWEFEHLFEPDSGQVYDAYNTSGVKLRWASTYNQGTFVGACMLLHEKYGDALYMEYAAQAAKYAMTRLDSKRGVLNGEDNGADVIGFKGILTRWLYRYAEYTNDADCLAWLQLNADTAFGNRNASNLIWTKWADKTLDKPKYDIFGLSTAVALLFNCEPWN